MTRCRHRTKAYPRRDRWLLLLLFVVLPLSELLMLPLSLYFRVDAAFSSSSTGVSSSSRIIIIDTSITAAKATRISKPGEEPYATGDAFYEGDGEERNEYQGDDVNGDNSIDETEASADYKRSFAGQEESTRNGARYTSSTFAARGVESPSSPPPPPPPFFFASRLATNDDDIAHHLHETVRATLKAEQNKAGAVSALETISETKAEAAVSLPTDDATAIGAIAVFPEINKDMAAEKQQEEKSPIIEEMKESNNNDIQQPPPPPLSTLKEQAALAIKARTVHKVALPTAAALLENIKPPSVPPPTALLMVQQPLGDASSLDEDEEEQPGGGGDVVVVEMPTASKKALMLLDPLLLLRQTGQGFGSFVKSQVLVPLTQIQPGAVPIEVVSAAGITVAAFILWSSSSNGIFSTTSASSLNLDTASTTLSTSKLLFMPGEHWQWAMVGGGLASILSATPGPLGKMMLAVGAIATETVVLLQERSTLHGRNLFNSLPPKLASTLQEVQRNPIAWFEQQQDIMLQWQPPLSPSSSSVDASSSSSSSLQSPPENKPATVVGAPLSLSTGQVLWAAATAPDPPNSMQETTTTRQEKDHKGLGSIITLNDFDAAVMTWIEDTKRQPSISQQVNRIASNIQQTLVGPMAQLAPDHIQDATVLGAAISTSIVAMACTENNVAVSSIVGLAAAYASATSGPVGTVLRATGGLAYESTWFVAELTRRVTYKLTHGVSWRQQEQYQQDDDYDYTVEDFDRIVAGKEPLLLLQQRQESPEPLYTTGDASIATEKDQVTTAAAASTMIDEVIATPSATTGNSSRNVPSSLAIKDAVVEKFNDTAATSVPSDATPKILETTSNQSNDGDQEGWLGSIGLGPTTTMDDVDNDANLIQSIKDKAAQSTVDANDRKNSLGTSTPNGIAGTKPNRNVPKDMPRNEPTTADAQQVDQEGWLGSIGLGPSRTTVEDETDVSTPPRSTPVMKTSEQSERKPGENTMSHDDMASKSLEESKLKDELTRRSLLAYRLKLHGEERTKRAKVVEPKIPTPNAPTRSTPVMKTSEQSERKPGQNTMSHDDMASKSLEESKQKEELTRRSLLAYRLKLHGEERTQRTKVVEPNAPNAQVVAKLTSSSADLQKQESLKVEVPVGGKDQATGHDSITTFGATNASLLIKTPAQHLPEAKAEKTVVENSDTGASIPSDTASTRPEARSQNDDKGEGQRSYQEDWLGSIGLGPAVTMDDTQSTENGISEKSVSVRDASKGEGGKRITSMTWLDAPHTRSPSFVVGSVSPAGGDNVEQVKGLTTPVAGDDSLQPNGMASQESFSVDNQNTTAGVNEGSKSVTVAPVQEPTKPVLSMEDEYLRAERAYRETKATQELIAKLNAVGVEEQLKFRRDQEERKRQEKIAASNAPKSILEGLERKMKVPSSVNGRKDDSKLKLDEQRQDSKSSDESKILDKLRRNGQDEQGQPQAAPKTLLKRLERNGTTEDSSTQRRRKEMFIAKRTEMFIAKEKRAKIKQGKQLVLTAASSTLSDPNGRAIRVDQAVRLFLLSVLYQLGKDEFMVKKDKLGLTQRLFCSYYSHDSALRSLSHLYGPSSSLSSSSSLVSDEPNAAKSSSSQLLQDSRLDNEKDQLGLSSSSPPPPPPEIMKLKVEQAARLVLFLVLKNLGQDEDDFMDKKKKQSEKLNLMQRLFCAYYSHDPGLRSASLLYENNQ